MAAPVDLDVSWVGPWEMWLIAWSASGVDSGWQHCDFWTVPGTAQVTPNPMHLSVASAQVSFTIATSVSVSHI